jgi:hypothetical protein
MGIRVRLISGEDIFINGKCVTHLTEIKRKGETEFTFRFYMSNLKGEAKYSSFREAERIHFAILKKM